jgi:hypothetical protein
MLCFDLTQLWYGMDMYAIMIYGERLGYELHVCGSHHVVDRECCKRQV